jgi:hypothetical protein
MRFATLFDACHDEGFKLGGVCVNHEGLVPLSLLYLGWLKLGVVLF